MAPKKTVGSAKGTPATKHAAKKVVAKAAPKKAVKVDTSALEDAPF